MEERITHVGWDAHKKMINVAMLRTRHARISPGPRRPEENHEQDRTEEKKKLSDPQLLVAEQGGGLLDVARRDPEDRSESAVGADGVQRRDVDLRGCQPIQQVGDCTDTVLSLHQESALRSRELPLRLLQEKTVRNSRRGASRGG